MEHILKSMVDHFTNRIVNNMNPPQNKIKKKNTKITIVNLCKLNFMVWLEEDIEMCIFGELYI
jgi:hypothetical protein